MSSEALIAWLIQAETPAIRFLTLQELTAASDQELQMAYAELEERGPVRSILARQTQAGAWSVDKSFYTPK